MNLGNYSRFLVTGGAGAIGSNLVRTLVERKKQVLVLDDLSSGHRELLPQGAELLAGCVSDPHSLTRAFEFRPDCVLHLAALFANQNSVEHPERDLLVNGQGTLNVLSMSQKHDVRKFVNVSSSCVYGNRENVFETGSELEPETPYAATKLLGENYTLFWARQHGLNTVTVRIFNSYGPGEFPGKYRNVIPNFISTALQGKPLQITGTGEETRDFTFVSDVVDGIFSLIDGKTQPGEIFNIASGRETRIIDLARMINDLTQNQAGVTFLPRRSWDGISRRKGNIEKIQSRLGYSPRVGLKEGLQQTLQWLKEQQGTSVRKSAEKNSADFV